MKNLDLIKKALNEVLLEEEEETTKQLSDAESPSDDFYHRLDEAFNKIMNERKRTLSLKKALTAALIAAIILASFSITVFAFGEEIKGFIVEFFDGFARLKASDGDLNHVDATNLRIGYIPEGFSQIKNDGSSSGGLQKWEMEVMLKPN